jgi:hypothetical protein
MIRTIEVTRVSRLAIISATAGLGVQLLAVPLALPPAPGLTVAPMAIPATSFVGLAEIRSLVGIVPASILSTSRINAPALVPGDVATAPAQIAATSRVLTPAVMSASGAIVAPDVIPVAAAVFLPTIAPGAVAIVAPAIAPGASISTPTIVPGAVSVQPAIVARTSTIAVPAVAVAASTGYDTDSQSYFAAMTVQPDATRKGLLNDLIVGLKADGIWAKLDWLCLLAAHDSQAGRVNAVVPAKTLSAVNSPTFTVDRGFLGDASSAHLSFAEAFNASGNRFALNSATIGAWCNLMSAFSGARPHIGSSQSTRTFITPANSGNAEFRVNDSSASYFEGTTRLGHRAGVRSDASTKKYYRDGVNTQTVATSGGAIATGPAYGLRNGTTYGDDRLSVLYFGAGFTDADAANMHTRLNTFLTTIGAN